MPLGLEEQSQIVKVGQSLRVVFAQFGLTSARQHGRIAQIASAHERRNWKPTMAIKRIESQALRELVSIWTIADSFAIKAICFQHHQTEINALWSFQGLCHDLVWKPNERNFGNIWKLLANIISHTLTPEEPNQPRKVQKGVTPDPLPKLPLKSFKLSSRAFL